MMTFLSVLCAVKRPSKFTGNSMSQISNANKWKIYNECKYFEIKMLNLSPTISKLKHFVIYTKVEVNNCVIHLLTCLK